jgi:hypothetical protein
MPHAAAIEATPDGGLHVSDAMYLGSHWEVRLLGAGEDVLVEQPAGQVPPAAGTRCRLRIAPDRIHAFTAGSA